MSTLAQARADVQAEFDEKDRVAVELREKNRLQAADNSELKRLLAKAQEQLAERTLQGTAAASVPAEASNKRTGPSSSCVKLSTDTLLDVFKFLTRFDLDVAGITCKSWRTVALNDKLSKGCLRQLDYVTLKPQKKLRVDPEGRKNIEAKCQLDNVDASSFQDALLQFQSISELVVGFRLLAGHISDGFLVAAGRKLGLTQLRYATVTPFDAEAVTFDATDDGIMQFMFASRKKDEEFQTAETDEEEVKLQISRPNISMLFCTALFKKALSEPAKNDLYLLVHVRNLEQDLTGIREWRQKSVYEEREVYTAEDSEYGKLICLTVSKEWGGTIKSIEFRRVNNYDDDGFRGGFGFLDDGWN